MISAGIEEVACLNLDTAVHRIKAEVRRAEGRILRDKTLMGIKAIVALAIANALIPNKRKGDRQ